MVAKVVGYKVFSSKKNDSMLCTISIVRQARQGSGEVGLISESHFLPKYLIDKVDDYLDKICNISFHKWNDTYTINNVTVINTIGLDAII